jgi:orotate phosphoribosyltransferase
VLDEFRNAGALLEGHFLLSSGKHSPVYLQCARVLMDPKRAERLCKALAEKIHERLGADAIDVVVSPAMGGVVVGYEMGRQLGVQTMFTERVDGEFTFRRGFELEEGARVLMAEDIITTGKSSLECIKCISDFGGRTVAASCLIDRSDGEVDLGLPMISLTGYKVPAFDADDLPPELSAIPAIKPGSRGLK